MHRHGTQLSSLRIKIIAITDLMSTMAADGSFLINAKEENKKNRDEDEVTHLLTWQKGNDGHPVFKKTK